MLPTDFGFEKTRGGTRWEEWETGGHRVGYELVDDERGEFVVYRASPGTGHAIEDEAWSRGEARRKTAELASDVDVTGGL
jgi:hypothetical protein